MVAINVVRQANAAFYRNRPLVAVFVGGTQGIGRYAVEALADLYSAQPETSLRVYVLGRRKSSADEVLHACRTRCAHGEFIFVQADNLALMKDVDATSAAILRLEREKEYPRIDLLVQTQAQILFGARKETEEGLDQLMSLVYYSRIRFIMQLMPLLEASPDGAHVVSVDAAGMEGRLFRDDLSLREPDHYGYVNAKSHATYMTTMAFERLASEHANMAYVYMYPGMVFGPSYRDPFLPWWFRAGRTLLEPLVRRTFATSPEDSGTRSLFLATPRFASAGSSRDSDNVAKGTNGSFGSGCYAVGAQSDIAAEKSHARLYPKLRGEGFQQEVWKHTMGAFDHIQVGKKFAD